MALWFRPVGPGRHGKTQESINSYKRIKRDGPSGPFYFALYVRSWPNQEVHNHHHSDYVCLLNVCSDPEVGHTPTIFRGPRPVDVGRGKLIGSPLTARTKGRESLGSNVITLCILWKWWARKGLNLGPRDYESPIPFVYVTES